MDTALAFKLLNLSVIPAWALLILAPRLSVTQKLVHSMLYPIALGLFYLGCMVISMAFGITGHVAFDGPVDFTTLEGVRNIFGNDMGVLIGWSHYLVFDLFVGAWEARDAQRRGISHWLLVPCLLLTFMLGPVGLLVYAAVRFGTRKGGWGLGEHSQKLP